MQNVLSQQTDTTGKAEVIPSIAGGKMKLWGCRQMTHHLPACSGPSERLSPEGKEKFTLFIVPRR